MADGMYDHGRNEFANGNIDWVNDTIKVILIDTDDYTVDLAADENLDDVAGAARVATGTLDNCSTSDGICDADDETLSAVSGDICEAIIIYKDSGAEATSTLIVYLDSLTGLPVTPNGGDIILTWDDGTNKIFKL